MQTYTDRGKEEEESYREVDRRKKKVQRFKHTHTHTHGNSTLLREWREWRRKSVNVCVCVHWIGLGGGSGEGGRERGQERKKISSKASENGGEEVK